MALDRSCSPRCVAYFLGLSLIFSGTAFGGVEPLGCYVCEERPGTIGWNQCQQVGNEEWGDGTSCSNAFLNGQVSCWVSGGACYNIVVGGGGDEGGGGSGSGGGGNCSGGGFCPAECFSCGGGGGDIFN